MAKRRILTVLVLVAFAAISTAQEGQVYPLEDESRCYDCHAPGLWTPPMDPNFELVPTAANVTLGEPFSYTAEIYNTWLSEQIDMFVSLDLGDAPSLQFVGGREPELGATTNGAIAVDPTTLTQPQREQVSVEVPNGSTALRFTLEPQDRDPTTGPDLSLRIYNAFTEPKNNPTFTVNAAGKGQPETFTLEGAGNIASHGFGTWIIEAEFEPISGTGSSTGFDLQPDGVPFRVIQDSWFNATEETVQVISKPGPIQPGGRDLFTWKLIAVAPPDGNETIRVIANVTAYYDHSAPSDPDDAPLRREASAPVRASGDNVVVGLDVQVTIVVPQTPGVSMAEISEVVGYAATFLLIASVWTGGMFGKASRRHLNVIFGSARRRVAFHNFLSYGIIVAAIVHLVLFIIEIEYHWALGLIWGGLGILALLLLGVTGALQVPMIRRWNYGSWRWIHLGLSIATIVFTLVHLALDGQNFQALVADPLGYEDPLVKALDPDRA